MRKRTIIPSPEKQVAPDYEDGHENTEGAEQAEDSLYYSVMDEKVVGMVRLLGESLTMPQGEGSPTDRCI